ncbi:MAG: aminotransferase class I/II-fold pyridoxal phosphate-dependent enzyme [Candidatus Portnoybacteria bacterium]|nr:aminotransferase class I/II-fold pyridoxal phosphate-dependent enzyme [Candidatus Portnoybacteria bacterium]
MKLISISLSPNVFGEDIRAAKTMLKEPSQWVKGEYIKEFEHTFEQYFKVEPEQIFTFNSGRSALLTILQSFGIGKGDEVMLQAFTCNAVPNPVIWVGAKPVYVDVKEDTCNMNVKDVEKKITSKSKAIIVQHTFGSPAELDEILKIARKHNLFVIEDCAHALGSTYKGKLVGTFGDAAFFSFGRDKVISSVYGGSAIVKLKAISYKLEAIYENLPYPSTRWIKQQLRHPLCISVLLQWYNAPLPNYGIGKFLLQLSQISRYLSKAVHWREKIGQKPDYFPARLPNALAYLALTQFKRLDEFNKHRRELADFYYESFIQDTRYKIQDTKNESIFLRYPIRNPKAYEIIRKARTRGILLGDWYSSPVAPDDTNLSAMHYQKGFCPAAEKLALETFNLPTNPNLSLDDAKRVVEFLKTLRI